jgi:DNA-binding transcriptional LysR family regulator
MNEVQTRELRYFIAVAEELNFSHAATRLGVAQPPLSRTIKQLEGKLGVQLVERTTRHVALTDAGRELLPHARRVIQTIDMACRRAQRVGKLPARLLVAVKPGGDTALLREVMDHYHQGNPGLPPAEIALSGRSGPVALLRDGSVDVGLVRTPFDATGLDFEPLFSEPRVAALPAMHPLAGRHQLRRAELADEPKPHWVGADDLETAYWAGQDDASPANPAPVPGPAVDGIIQLLEIVALGKAVAFLPSSTQKRYPRADIVYRPVLDLTPHVMVIAWPQMSRSLAVAAIVRSATAAAAARSNPGQSTGTASARTASP